MELFKAILTAILGVLTALFSILFVYLLIAGLVLACFSPAIIFIWLILDKI